jgi:hypothetical protein
MNHPFQKFHSLLTFRWTRRFRSFRFLRWFRMNLMFRKFQS